MTEEQAALALMVHAQQPKVIPCGCLIVGLRMSWGWAVVPVRFCDPWRPAAGWTAHPGAVSATLRAARADLQAMGRDDLAARLTEGNLEQLVEQAAGEAIRLAPVEVAVELAVLESWQPKILAA